MNISKGDYCIETINPLEQGLKPSSLQNFYIVILAIETINPLEQGLKPFHYGLDYNGLRN